MANDTNSICTSAETYEENESTIDVTKSKAFSIVVTTVVSNAISNVASGVASCVASGVAWKTRDPATEVLHAIHLML